MDATCGTVRTAAIPAAPAAQFHPPCSRGENGRRKPYTGTENKRNIAYIAQKRNVYGHIVRYSENLWVLGRVRFSPPFLSSSRRRSQPLLGRGGAAPAGSARPVIQPTAAQGGGGDPALAGRGRLAPRAAWPQSARLQAGINEHSRVRARRKVREAYRSARGDVRAPLVKRTSVENYHWVRDTARCSC